MSVLTIQQQATGLLTPLARFELEHPCGWLDEVDRLSWHCRAVRLGGRRTLLPASRFPTVTGMFEDCGQYDPDRFEQTRRVASEVGAAEHVYLALNAWSDSASGSAELWIAAVHSKIGLADLRRLDAVSGGSVRWVSPAGQAVPMNEQMVRSRW